MSDAALTIADRRALKQAAKIEALEKEIAAHEATIAELRATNIDQAQALGKLIAEINLLKSKEYRW